MSEYKKKFVLDEERIPKAWYNILPDLPTPPPPPAPGDQQPAGPDDLAPLFPMELIKQEVSQSGTSRSPRRSARSIDLASDAARPRARASRRRSDTPATSTTRTRASARPAATSPTPPSRRRTTTRSRASSASPPRPAPASGAAPCLGLQVFDLECKVYMVKVSYDQKPYRRSHDAGSGAARSSPARATRPTPARRPRGGPGQSRAASASPSARRSRTPRRTRTPSTRSAACSTTCCCTRRSSARRRMKQMPGRRRVPRRRHRLRRRRLQLRRHRLPLPARQARRQDEDPLRRGRADGLPDPDQGRVPLRLRRHGADHAAVARCTRSATTSCRPASTPAACATTAWPRWSATCMTLGLLEAKAFPQTPASRRPALRPDRGDYPGAGELARHPRRNRRGTHGQGSGRKKVILFNLSGHGLLDLGLRRLPRRRPGRRPPRGGNRGIDREAPEGRVATPARPRSR